ncbi:MAG TPA: poly-gamma-glutamate synthase PgsB [Acidobacteriota bacterium]|nr:poly-gamma-glutamate synthase PgsB [Acidobacteriota bacterium]
MRSVALFILLFCLASFVLFLTYERITLTCRLNRIPLRIAVTGSRGKSTVARMLASILSEDGKKVLAKTTGSQAMLLLPDGSVLELHRRGNPSILEQTRVVKVAARHHADCLVAEIMSIHPENHYIEAQRILKPNIVAVTNVRLDHTEAMGDREEDIASVLSLDIPPHSAVFIPEQAPQLPFSQAAGRTWSTLLTVKPGAAAPILEMAPHVAGREFRDNLDLVYSIARHLNVSERIILNGILKARFDIGKLKVWRARSGDNHHSYYMVNAFAANDPESTVRVLSKVLELLPAASDKVIGILNLRADRLQRTLQWIEILKHGTRSRFSRLYVIGGHCGLVRRRLPDVEILRGGSAERLTAHITSGIPDGAVVFGFGNIKGAGMLLASHWSKIGEDYGI